MRKIKQLGVISICMLMISANSVLAAGSTDRTECATVWGGFSLQQRSSYGRNYTKAIQRILYHVSGAPHSYICSVSDIDGIFGDDTYNAVCAFQGLQGISSDGAVGKNTWRGLYYSLKAPVSSSGFYCYKSTDSTYGTGYIIRQKISTGDWYVKDGSGSWVRFYDAE